MKKIAFWAEVEVPEEFKAGDCRKCPLVKKEKKDNGYGYEKTELKCPFGHCPFKEQKQ